MFSRSCGTCRKANSETEARVAGKSSVLLASCRFLLPDDLCAKAEGDFPDCNLGKECFARPPSSLVWLKASFSSNVFSCELPPLPCAILSFALMQLCV